MNSKMNIRKKQIRRIGILVAFVLLLIFSYVYNSTGSIDQVDISITNPEYKFVDQKSVLAYLNKSGYLKNNTIEKSKIHELERALRNHNYIDTVEVYVDKKSHLNIVVTQMQPVARVFLSRNSKSFYLKKDNKLIPTSIDYTARVPIVTGFDHVVKDTFFRQQFADMMAYIAEDSLWSVQIQQLDISRHDEITMYPLIGDHVIFMGSVIDYLSKFENLYQFYKQVLSNKGFDFYQKIDVRFNHQVVASPSIHSKDPTNKNNEHEK